MREELQNQAEEFNKNQLLRATTSNLDKASNRKAADSLMGIIEEEEESKSLASEQQEFDLPFRYSEASKDTNTPM